MKISVLGMGYVGCVSAACLASQGHQVLGMDVNPDKVDLISQGKSPIIERQVPDIVRQTTSEGTLKTTLDSLKAVADSEVSMICVGTPSRQNGSLDVQYIQNAARSIGKALRERNEHHLVVVRSTVLPGTTESVVIPAIEEASGKRMGEGFGVCVNPEFLREGSAVEDYYHPAFTLIGCDHKADGDLLEMIYRPLDAPVIRADIRTAEMVKYVSNAFHALKISFANEMGKLCRKIDVDSQEVMDIFVQDTRLNISSKYLRPGFAFGGSCLPKDLRAITYLARSLDLDLPVLNAILPSNDRQIDHAFQLIRSVGRKRVGILGLSFKAGTDDLRESPMVRLVERLLGKGYDISIYDREVSMAKIVGSNKRYIEQVIPHISELLAQDLEQVLSHAEVLVVGHDSAEFQDALGRLKDDQYVIDLIGIASEKCGLDDGRYQGICW